jgi:glycosyltransferase involved in cell wall biosynthesis
VLKNWKALFYFAEAAPLVTWMNKVGADHLHVHFANPAATVALIASKYGLFDYSISVHGPDIFDNIRANLLPEKIEKASFIRCISDYSRSQLMRWSAPKHWDAFHIVRCGIHPDVYQPRPDPRNDILHILCVGRLVAAKGQLILLKACEQLKKEGIPFRLTFVGDGEDRPQLEKERIERGLQEEVTFTGAVGQDAIHSYYDQADLFVLPSFAEGVPVVLMEAMAKEIAVISTRITGIPELIEHDVDGVLVPPSNVDALAREIKKLGGDQERRAHLGREGRKKVLQLYNLS